MVYPVVAKNLLRRVSRSGLALVVAGSLGSSLPAIPPHPVRVRVEPRSTSLTPGTTISFTATVVNTTDQGVFWSVDGIPGGDDTVGTINGTGDTVTYTAPFADAAGVHRIQAESLGNTALSAMALVAVVASPVLSVVVNPPTSSLTLGAAAQQQFTAKLTGKSPLRYDLDRQLVWSALNGSITSTGLYTPPVYGGADEVFATVVWPDRHRRHRREDVPMDPPTPPAMTATGTGVITVVDPSTIGTVSVSPLTMTLRGRAKSQFTAEVTGTGHFNKGVAWFAQRGTITSEGLYTAPATGGSDVVTASSLETPAVSASATITVDVTLSRVALVPVHLDMYGPVEVQQNSGPYSEGIATVSPGVITDGWVASGGTLLSPPNFYLAQFEALAGPFMDMSFSANGTIDDRQLVVLPFPPRDYLADLNTLITSYDSTIKAQINTGNCANYYFTSYWLMGLAAAADATGDTSVMATLIGYIQQLIAQAQPMGLNGVTYQEWGPPASTAKSTSVPGFTNSIPQQLNTFQATGPLARTLAVIARNPTFGVIYNNPNDPNSVFKQIAAFVDQSIFQYWFNKPNGYYANTGSSASPAFLGGTVPWLSIALGGWGGGGVDVDTCDHFGMISTWMYQATQNPLYLEYATRVAKGFRDHITVNNGCLQWDLGVWPITTGQNQDGSPDTSHGNREAMMVVSMYEAGIEYQPSDVQELAATLTNVIWNQNYDDPMFSNYIDGSNQLYRTAGAWENGVLLHGWNMVGRYSAKAQRILAILYDDLQTGKVQNPSLSANNSSGTDYGLFEFSGALRRNIVAQ